MFVRISKHISSRYHFLLLLLPDSDNVQKLRCSRIPAPLRSSLAGFFRNDPTHGRRLRGRDSFRACGTGRTAVGGVGCVCEERASSCLRNTHACSACTAPRAARPSPEDDQMRYELRTPELLTPTGRNILTKSTRPFYTIPVSVTTTSSLCFARADESSGW